MFGFFRAFRLPFALRRCCCLQPSFAVSSILPSAAAAATATAAADNDDDGGAEDQQEVLDPLKEITEVAFNSFSVDTMRMFSITD